MQFLDEKDLRIKELENENKKLQEKVNMLEHNVELLTQAVLHASKQRFGASSEKTLKADGQCSLLGETYDEILDESKIINIKEHKRPVRKKGDREKLIKALPHEVVECGKNDINPYDSIYCAAVSAPVLTHSVASPSIIAWIMYQKYMMSMPLYRQEKDFKRMGAELKRDMMANWIIRSSEYWLKPLYEIMHKQLLKASIIMSDETTWQVNKEKDKKASSKSYIWIHRTSNCEGPPVILYQYTRSRSGDHAKAFLD